MMPFLLEDIDSLPDALAHYRQTVQELVAICPPCRLRLSTDKNKYRSIDAPWNKEPPPEGVAYLTIDEKVVEEGKTQRQRGLHVDGIGADGQLDTGIWAIHSYRNFVASMWQEGAQKWQHSASGIGGMITVSNPAGCRAWYKDFEGKIDNNGDCEALRAKFPESESTVFEAGVAYWCGATCVHESLPMQENTQRTFVRLSMPSDAPWHEGYTRNPKGIKPTGVIIPRGAWDRVKEPEVILKG
jgi:hypothetical protein